MGYRLTNALIGVGCVLPSGLLGLARALGGLVHGLMNLACHLIVVACPLAVVAMIVSSLSLCRRVEMARQV
ncbi:hypothetical protein [Halomonas sp. 328]|uniref:hypothetical protein n=1 Tax=Halomonas sp. 328 TaxID=2776704 RepID=UPI0018A78A77|nr:hypothetical protein [Halomonas sp. 328]MBF8221822.1 hypothetical protein [Halomonas sp. 328]